MSLQDKTKSETVWSNQSKWSR